MQLIITPCTLDLASSPLSSTIAVVTIFVSKLKSAVDFAKKAGEGAREFFENNPQLPPDSGSNALKNGQAFDIRPALSKAMSFTPENNQVGSRPMSAGSRSSSRPTSASRPSTGPSFLRLGSRSGYQRLPLAPVRT